MPRQEREIVVLHYLQGYSSAEITEPVRGATREAALVAARRLDPPADLTQIQPTELAITLLYSWGTSQSNGAYQIHTTGPGDAGIGRWRNKNG